MTWIDNTSARPLEGKVALITGGTKNLGQATATALGGLGADLVINFHDPQRSAETEGTAERIRTEQGCKALALRADITSADEVALMFDQAIAEFGRLDILINNAGVLLKKAIADTTEEEFDHCFMVNTKGTFLTMREAARRLADGGRIVSLVTTILSATMPFYGVYAGSKAPLEHLTKALALEVGRRGITVNCVSPGPLNTSFFYPAEDENSIAYAKSHSIGQRLGEVDDVAPLIAFLCTPQAGWITAQTIRVNGGMI
jgi:NAD(P)-dependent dehydrogenase (short-subunit alcohol dehydrogenase family)